jgi:hypothetical protein
MAKAQKAYQDLLTLGKDADPDNLSSSRPGQNTRNYSHSASSTNAVWKAKACGAQIEHIVGRLSALGTIQVDGLFEC